MSTFLEFLFWWNQRCFMFLINWKTKFKILYLDFVFTSIRKTKFKKMTTIFMFNGFLLWIFNALIRFFIFIKKMENEIQFVFRFSFLWRNWKMNYLNRSRYDYDYYHKYGLHDIQEQVRVKSPEVFRCAMVTQIPRIGCLENSWCILMFILLAATFIFY